MLLVCWSVFAHAFPAVFVGSQVLCGSAGILLLSMPQDRFEHFQPRSEVACLNGLVGDARQVADGPRLLHYAGTTFVFTCMSMTVCHEGSQFAD
jgi:hypothetical protein